MLQVFLKTHNDVPQFAAGFPIMMLSETPAMLSILPKADASNKWSVVFSKDASIRTLSFIFATPNRVIPSTSPYEAPPSHSSVNGEKNTADVTNLVGHEITK